MPKNMVPIRNEVLCELLRADDLQAACARRRIAASVFAVRFVAPEIKLHMNPARESIPAWFTAGALVSLCAQCADPKSSAIERIAEETAVDDMVLYEHKCLAERIAETGKRIRPYLVWLAGFDIGFRGFVEIFRVPDPAVRKEMIATAEGMTVEAIKDEIRARKLK